MAEYLVEEVLLLAFDAFDAGGGVAVALDQGVDDFLVAVAHAEFLCEGAANGAAAGADLAADGYYELLSSVHIR